MRFTPGAAYKFFSTNFKMEKQMNKFVKSTFYPRSSPSCHSKTLRGLSMYLFHPAYTTQCPVAGITVVVPPHPSSSSSECSSLLSHQNMKEGTYCITPVLAALTGSLSVTGLT